MYFNFEDYRPDTPTLPRSLTRLEVVLLTIVVYLCVVIMMLVWPNLPWVRAAEARRQQAIEEIRKQQLEQQREAARFVFMQPRVDLKSLKPPPPRSELSDIDRRARTTERAPNPTNSMPFARGNTSERVEASPPVAGREASPQPEPSPEPADPARQGLTLPDSRTAVEPRPTDQPPRDSSAGVIANALRNAQRYAQKSGMGNLQGGANQEIAPSIQFDSKGVDFGPWLRRFIAQIKRNWLIPYAAMTWHGHVVVTFYVGKDGRITELKVLKPSSVDAFNHSAFGALVASNPTQPLPPEYPDDRAFFTVTFFFNEDPGTR